MYMASLSYHELLAAYSFAPTTYNLKSTPDK